MHHKRNPLKQSALAISFALAGMAFGNVAMAAGDAAAGEKVFKTCKSCHKVGDGAKNGVGPVLTGVVGRAAGSYDGYKYSKSVKAANEKGLVWTEELIVEWLADPKVFLREYLGDDKAKTKMSFKLKDEQKRKDVAAYLATFSE